MRSPAAVKTSSRYASVVTAPYRSIIQATADQNADFLAGNPLTTSDSIDRLVAEVSWLAAACRIVATVVSTYPFDLTTPGEDEPYATENDLAQHPEWLRGHMEGWQRLVYRLAYSWLVHGQAYTWPITGSRTQGLKGLQFLPASQVHAVIEKQAGLVGWRIGGASKVHPVEAVIPFWEPSITASVGWGPAPCLAAGSAAKLLQSLDCAVNTAFANGPIMITLVGFPENTEQGTIDAVMADLNDLAAGRTRAGTMIPIRMQGASANAQPELITKELSIKPDEMVAPEIESSKILAIAAAVGCPVSALRSDASHFSVMESDGINLYELRANGMFNHICEQINEWVGERSGTIIEPQKDRLPCYQDQRLKVAQALASLTGGKAIMSVGEARVEIGLREEMPDEPGTQEPETTAPADTSSTMPQEPTAGPDDAGQPARGARAIPPAVLLSPDVTESVRLWARKSKRRGELVTWESDIVPAELRATVARMYAAHGWRGAFSWARARKNVMDDLVAEFQADLSTEFAKMSKGIAATAAAKGAIDWAAISTQYANTLGPRMAEIVTDGFMRLGNKFGPQWDAGLVHTKALEFAKAHAYDRGKLFVETTKPIVEDALAAYYQAPDMGAKGLQDLLAEKLGPAFSDARVEQIAVTEVTTAVEASTQEYQELINEELGVKMVRTWNYQWAGDRGADYYPCVICEQLNGKAEDADGMWHAETGKGTVDISGPPAHVHCYCTTSLGLPE